MISKIKDRDGFTLIEILVTLFLMTMVLVLVATVSENPRQEVDSFLNDLERAIRFSGDEAALRNTIVRIRFVLDKRPQEYTVEYGPDDSFVIPTSELNEANILSLSEQANREKETQELDRNFNRVPEFKEMNRKIPESIRILGVGSSLQKRLTTDFQASIYIYPSGERDDAVVIIGSPHEVVFLAITPFTAEFEREYFSIPSEGDGPGQEQVEKAEEIFKNWQK